MFSSSPISAPFGNDEQIHVSKEASDQDNLWHKLKEEVHFIFEVLGIKGFHADTKRHLEHSENN